MMMSLMKTVQITATTTNATIHLSTPPNPNPQNVTKTKTYQKQTSAGSKIASQTAVSSPPSPMYSTFDPSLPDLHHVPTPHAAHIDDLHSGPRITRRY